ncbi:MFS transporter [Oleiagrimonas sp. C23AA]|uniref:MFS transporter n=1 Tax=Oleiagrimonas sp. C23AA TaxID=2719047 RepID=UPI00142458A3|nr:MFS transporter [Oleiagrimonas sp. C23AA]NII10356.1 YbfB/YjiJ family MFS transporter [Oleiagrimonas sp. C23AA]
MSRALKMGATGFGLIAVCYGFARFAFGLFLPQIRTDLALSDTYAGTIAGGAFLAYVIAIMISARTCERMGAKAVAVISGLTAAAGMLGIAISPSPTWLAMFVVLAGVSTGLASPPMALAVSQGVDRAQQNATNTVINAGTSGGVVISGLVALGMSERWREVFVLFAGSALAAALAAWRWLPSGSAESVTSPRKAAHVRTPARGTLWQLIGASFLAGVSSTALWSFGGEMAARRLHWSTHGISLLWIAIGAAGVSGAAAGILVTRLGINRVHRGFLAILATGTSMAGLSFTTPLATVLGGALFGSAYVMLTGIYLVWGTSALPHRPASGLMVGFLTLAIGQTAGAPLFAQLMQRTSLQTATIAFSCLAVSAGLFQFNGHLKASKTAAAPATMKS